MTVSFFLQVDLQPVTDRIDRLSPPTDIFRAVAENAVQLSSSERASDDLLDELCCNESLAGVSICLYTLVFELLIRSLHLFSCLIVCAQSHQKFNFFLVQEYLEMLRSDVSKLLEGRSGRDKS